VSRDTALSPLIRTKRSWQTVPFVILTPCINVQKICWRPQTMCLIICRLLWTVMV